MQRLLTAFDFILLYLRWQHPTVNVFHLLSFCCPARPRVVFSLCWSTSASNSLGGFEARVDRQQLLPGTAAADSCCSLKVDLFWAYPTQVLRTSNKSLKHCPCTKTSKQVSGVPSSAQQPLLNIEPLHLPGSCTSSHPTTAFMYC